MDRVLEAVSQELKQTFVAATMEQAQVGQFKV
jgi:hypothetical protein